MQGVVFVDMLVVVNTIIGYFVLRATAYFCACTLSTKRIVGAAFLAGLSSLAMLLTDVTSLFLLLVKIVCAMLIVLLAFKYKNLRLYLKTLFFFISLNIILGGVVIFAALSGAKNISFSNYSVYINISPVLLIGCILIMYLIIYASMYVFGASGTVQHAEYCAEINGASISGVALVDSGMHIKDAMTSRSAVLCSYQSVKTRLQSETSEALRKYFEEGELRTPFWLVSIKTATGTQMLPALKASGLTFTANPNICIKNKVQIKNYASENKQVAKKSSELISEKRNKKHENIAVFVFTNETILDGGYDIIVHPSTLK